ncbi:hypothetical protein, partial [Bacteroides acidifaciens]|uniref:hypothetical protein n=1 Tax=Bacteroides acidifaciens TaxID=85831 RepID=UPI0025A568AF
NPREIRGDRQDAKRLPQISPYPHRSPAPIAPPPLPTPIPLSTLLHTTFPSRMATLTSNP